jgi:hypothetical protein
MELIVKSLIRSLSLLAGILLLASAAFADSNLDPKIIIGDPACSGCISVTSDHFSFALPTNQGSFFTGTLQFQNNSGKTWYSLFLTETVVPWFDVSCKTNAFFNDCIPVASSKSNPNQTTIEFLNVTPHPRNGIPSGGVFSLSFQPVNGNAWPSGTSFDAQANAASVVPEPASLTLFVSGIGAIIARRKLGKNRVA